MSNKIEDMRVTILTKRFSRVPNAGYDPLEVDKFLDHVSKNLKEFSHELESLYRNKEFSGKKIFELQKLLEKETEKSYILDLRNKDLLKEGYQSHSIIQEINKIKKKMNEK